ncbi:MAG: hypothetical protein V9E96_11705 [Chitinophagaceae bacterium]
MTTKLILVIVFIVCLVLMAYMKTNKRKKVVFLGDSITQLGLQSKWLHYTNTSIDTTRRC